jgi:hypothetical protein
MNHSSTKRIILGMRMPNQEHCQSQKDEDQPRRKGSKIDGEEWESTPFNSCNAMKQQTRKDEDHRQEGSKDVVDQEQDVTLIPMGRVVLLQVAEDGRSQPLIPCEPAKTRTKQEEECHQD